MPIQYEMVSRDLLAPVHHQLQHILKVLFAEWDGVGVDIVSLEN